MYHSSRSGVFIVILFRQLQITWNDNSSYFFTGSYLMATQKSPSELLLMSIHYVCFCVCNKKTFYLDTWTFFETTLYQPNLCTIAKTALDNMLFSIQKYWYFSFSPRTKTYVAGTLEVFLMSTTGVSNEYHDICFCGEIRKNMITFQLEKKVSHYVNMPIQIYWKFYHQKRKNFILKNLIFFIFLLKT